MLFVQRQFLFSLWGKANARNVMFVILRYGGNLTLINSFDTKFKVFTSLWRGSNFSSENKTFTIPLLCRNMSCFSSEWINRSCLFNSSTQGKSGGFTAYCSSAGKWSLYRQQTSSKTGRRTQIPREGWRNQNWVMTIISRCKVIFWEDIFLFLYVKIHLTSQWLCSRGKEQFILEVSLLLK